MVIPSHRHYTGLAARPKSLHAVTIFMLISIERLVCQLEVIGLMHDWLGVFYCHGRVNGVILLWFE